MPYPTTKKAIAPIRDPASARSYEAPSTSRWSVGAVIKYTEMMAQVIPVTMIGRPIKANLRLPTLSTIDIPISCLSDATHVHKTDLLTTKRAFIPAGMSPAAAPLENPKRPNRVPE
jgi:hypothetical protein